MKIVKIVLSLVLSFYLVMGLLAGLFITSSVGVSALTATECINNNDRTSAACAQYFTSTTSTPANEDLKIKSCLNDPVSAAQRAVCYSLSSSAQQIANTCFNTPEDPICSKYIVKAPTATTTTTITASNVSATANKLDGGTLQGVKLCLADSTLCSAISGADAQKIISFCQSNTSDPTCSSFKTSGNASVATAKAANANLNQILTDPAKRAEFCKASPNDPLCTSPEAKKILNIKPLGTNLDDVIGFAACNVSGSAAKDGDKLQECIRSILQFAVILAGIIAVIQLGVAAFNYFNPDVSTDTIKSSVDTIRNIFIGLMLILAPVIILRTFNVSLTNFGFLGFSANTSTSSSQNTNGTNTTTGTNSTTDTKQVGKITLKEKDTKANIKTLQDEIAKKGTADFNQADVQNALNLVLSDAANSNLDTETRNSLAALIASAQNNGLNIDPNVLSKINSTGTNPDGNQTANQASYCTAEDCTITGAQLLTGPNNSYQILTVNLRDKNTNPTNFTMYLRPANQIPSPINGWISLPAPSTATNQAATVTKNKISGSEFSQWCSTAQAQPGGTGGTACFKSPASSTDLYLDEIFDLFDI